MTEFHTYRESFSNARLTRGQLLQPTNQDGVKDFGLTTGVVPHFAANGAARWDRAPVVKGMGK